LGLYTSVAVGLLQIANMSELAIQVKLSARKIELDVALKRIKQVKVGLFVLIVFTYCVGIFDVYNAHAYNHENGKTWHAIAVTTTNASIFFLNSIGLLIAFSFFSYNVNTYFPK